MITVFLSQMASRQFYVYILSSASGTLYIGMTNDLERRISEHKYHTVPGFTARYRVDRLVYYEAFDTPEAAIVAEKRLKGWTRARKLALVTEQNPYLRDLSEDW